MKNLKLTRKQVTGLVFAIPGIVYLLLFFIYPFAFTVFLSFHEYPLIAPPEYAGLDNFVKLFTEDIIFPDSIFATFYYSFGYCVGIWVLSLASALFFRNRFKGRTLYVTIFLVVSMIGIVPQAMAWKVLLHPIFGVFNNLFFYSWGYPGKLNWFTSIPLAMPGLIIATLASGIPFYSVYLLGALGGVPEHYYEVAKLGGANFFQRLRYVTLPSIRPIYLYVMITSLIACFQRMTPFYIITGGGPINTTRVLSLYIYHKAFYYYEFGYAAAISILLLMIMSVFCYFALKVMSR